MKKKHEFIPSLDGKLEDRLVLNGARASAVLLAQQNHYNGINDFNRPTFPRSAVLTTRAYNNVLVNIHRATEQFGRSRGFDRDYMQLSNNIGRQLQRIPYARMNGLTDYVQDSTTLYAPQESRILYGDIRSTLVSYLSDEVYGGQVGIRKSPGHYFSDADIHGPHALIFQAPEYPVEPETPVNLGG